MQWGPKTEAEARRLATEAGYIDLKMDLKKCNVPDHTFGELEGKTVLTGIAPPSLANEQGSWQICIVIPDE